MVKRIRKCPCSVKNGHLFGSMYVKNGNNCFTVQDQTKSHAPSFHHVMVKRIRKCPCSGSATVTLDDYWLMTCMRSYVSNRKAEVSTQERSSRTTMIPLSTCLQSQGLCVEKFVFVWEILLYYYVLKPSSHHFLWSDKENIYVSKQCQFLQFFLCSCNLRSLRICGNLTSQGLLLFIIQDFALVMIRGQNSAKGSGFVKKPGVIRRAKCVRGCSGLLRAVAALFSPPFPLCNPAEN